MGGIYLLILAREFPREPLRRTTDPLQRVGGIQHPALRRTVEYLDCRLARLRTVKSNGEHMYLSMDFMIDRVLQKFVIFRASVRKLNIDVSIPCVENFFKDKYNFIFSNFLEFYQVAKKVN